MILKHVRSTYRNVAGKISRKVRQIKKKKERKKQMKGEERETEG